MESEYICIYIYITKKFNQLTAKPVKISIRDKDMNMLQTHEDYLNKDFN